MHISLILNLSRHNCIGINKDNLDACYCVEIFNLYLTNLDPLGKTLIERKKKNNSYSVSQRVFDLITGLITSKGTCEDQCLYRLRTN